MSGPAWDFEGRFLPRGLDLTGTSVFFSSFFREEVVDRVVEESFVLVEAK